MSVLKVYQVLSNDMTWKFPSHFSVLDRFIRVMSKGTRTIVVQRKNRYFETVCVCITF